MSGACSDNASEDACCSYPAECIEDEGRLVCVQHPDAEATLYLLDFMYFAIFACMCILLCHSQAASSRVAPRRPPPPRPVQAVIVESVDPIAESSPPPYTEEVPLPYEKACEQADGSEPPPQRAEGL